MPGHTRAKPLDMAWAKTYPESTEDKLVLALEFEQSGWNAKDDGAWWRSAEEESDKILRANAQVGVLILSRDRSKSELDHGYLGRATARIDKAFNGRRTGKWLLVVLLTPPLKNNEGHCTAHGFIYGKSGTKYELGSIDCWREA